MVTVSLRSLRLDVPLAFSIILWSAANSFSNRSKCSGSKRVFGFESILIPFVTRNSTIVGNPTFSSPAAFPNLIGFPAISILYLEDYIIQIPNVKYGIPLQSFLFLNLFYLLNLRLSFPTQILLYHNQ